MTAVRSARLLLLLVLAACSQASPLRSGMKAVEQIRGRKFVREVKNVTIDRSELTAHLRRQMAASTPYSMADWATVLRALQLVEVKTDDLLPKLLSLYESQVLAFYDPHSHTYYSIRQLPKLPEEMAKLIDPEQLEETVMVHELTHALQDQHFGLSQREKALMRDTDANLAYHAVLEGEAVMVMVAHMLAKSGVNFDEVVKDEAILAAMSSAANAGQMIDPSTPPYLVEMMKFPYLSGLSFVVEAYRRGGWKEIDRIHADPPRSTREILHPEEYFARTSQPPSFDSTTPKGAIAAEHLGEFHWRFLVGESNSRGWLNDRVVVFRNGNVEIDTLWESEARATAFATAYESFLKQRGINVRIIRDGGAVKASYKVTL